MYICSCRKSVFRNKAAVVDQETPSVSTLSYGLIITFKVKENRSELYVKLLNNKPVLKQTHSSVAYLLCGGREGEVQQQEEKEEEDESV
jgi:hypothetical protein